MIRETVPRRKPWPPGSRHSRPWPPSGSRPSRRTSSYRGWRPVFEDRWFEGVRDVANYLLRIADTTAAQRGRAASSAQLLTHFRRPAPKAPVAEPGCGAGREGDPRGGAAVHMGLHRPRQPPRTRRTGGDPGRGPQRCTRRRTGRLHAAPGSLRRTAPGARAYGPAALPRHTAVTQVLVCGQRR